MKNSEKDDRFLKYPEEGDFFTLLLWHFDNGTRPNEDYNDSWEDRELVEATGFSERTIKNWRLKKNLPQDISVIRRLLFNKTENHSYWKYHLTQEYNQYKLNSKSDLNSEFDQSEAEKRIKSIVQKEWADLELRIKMGEPSSESRTHVFLYGWLSSLGYGHKVIDHKISLQSIKNEILEFSGYRAVRDRKNVIACVCTCRYLCFVHIISKGINEGYIEICEAMIAGFSSERLKNIPLNYDCADVIETISSDIDQDQLISSLCAIMFDLSKKSRSMGISIIDILEEESEKHRLAMNKTKRNKILIDNDATHEIEIYFSDTKGQYYKIMNLFSNQIPFNILKSSSETLVPGKIARCNLLVCCDSKYLEGRIQNELERDSQIKKSILEYSVKEIH